MIHLMTSLFSIIDYKSILFAQFLMLISYFVALIVLLLLLNSLFYSTLNNIIFKDDKILDNIIKIFKTIFILELVLMFLFFIGNIVHASIFSKLYLYFNEDTCFKKYKIAGEFLNRLNTFLFLVISIYFYPLLFRKKIYGFRVILASIKQIFNTKCLVNVSIILVYLIIQIFIFVINIMESNTYLTLTRYILVYINTVFNVFVFYKIGSYFKPNKYG